MIIKCVNKGFGYNINVNEFYPVISYKEDLNDKISKYQILDNGNFLSYIPFNMVELLHNHKSCYRKSQGIEGEDECRYKTLSNVNFYRDFYDESVVSNKARKKLFDCLIDIYADECSKEELIELLKNMNFSNNYYILVLKAFFKNVEEKNVIQLLSYLNNKVTEFDNALIKNLFLNLKNYELSEVTDFFMNIYVNNQCIDDEISNILDSYFCGVF